MQIQSILKNFGLKDKDIAVYLSLVELGPSPVRLIASKSGVNRGTTYDILKSLIALGLVSYYQKESHQYFVAESPDKLLGAIEDKSRELEKVRTQIEESLPALKSLFEKQGGKPVMKLFEGNTGLKQILQDVLSVMDLAKDKTYYVYSSASLRKSVYESMPEFSKKRIKAGIEVKTIALGEGGQLVGMDERKWLKTAQNPKATYEIIYGGKIAHISLDHADNAVGIVIENPDIYETQKLIFEFNWNNL
jgi:sugar-specific transcriptional regulator TrmB